MATTIVSHGITVEGTISGPADLKVDGEINGIITVESSIYITETGKVEAEVKAGNVFIEGVFDGEIVADDLIQISPGGMVKGNLKAPAISIEKGATFSGQIDMGDLDASSGFSSRKDSGKRFGGRASSSSSTPSRKIVAKKPEPAIEKVKEEKPKDKKPSFSSKPFEGVEVKGDAKGNETADAVKENKDSKDSKDSKENKEKNI